MQRPGSTIVHTDHKVNLFLPFVCFALSFLPLSYILAHSRTIHKLSLPNMVVIIHLSLTYPSRHLHVPPDRSLARSLLSNPFVNLSTVCLFVCLSYELDSHDESSSWCRLALHQRLFTRSRRTRYTFLFLGQPSLTGQPNLFDTKNINLSLPYYTSDHDFDIHYSVHDVIPLSPSCSLCG